MLYGVHNVPNLADYHAALNDWHSRSSIVQPTDLEGNNSHNEDRQFVCEFPEPVLSSGRMTDMLVSPQVHPPCQMLCRKSAQTHHPLGYDVQNVQTTVRNSFEPTYVVLCTTSFYSDVMLTTYEL